ncbi:sensor histidine kinase [Clostridioides sp. ES-S-0001-02]|uniref:sensor histidine kinase n=1 Tax=Clostridioides sp. ES-S-0001-02 TaxID=2770770 RepID=UPI001D119A2D|nr:GHKL domain-containing protein [Clostridioides sp. ES-S-0001-02]
MANLSSSNVLLEYSILFVFAVDRSLMAVLQYYFLISFTNTKSKFGDCILYLLVSVLSISINTYFNLYNLFYSRLIFFLLTFLFVKYVIKKSTVLSIVLSLLVYIIEQLAYGFIAPFNYLLFINNTDINIYKFVINTEISFFITIIIVGFIYWYSAKKFNIKTVKFDRYSIILIMPLLLIILFWQSFEHTGYSSSTINIDTKLQTVKLLMNTSLTKEIQAFLFSSIGIICVFFSLFEFKKLMQYLKEEKNKAILNQQIHSQKNYIEEAKSRLSQTMSFRHDFNNHLAIVNGLLKKGEILKAQEYLNKLEKITSDLSFSCNTGNVVIDALFNNKLSIAKQLGIQVDCDVIIPSNTSINDVDLCIVFANAIDNAIKACKFVDKRNRYLKLSTKLDGGFFMIEIRNSYNAANNYTSGSGIGISNIREVAKKYQGAISIENTSDYFQINILLIISLHYTDISEQLT